MPISFLHRRFLWLTTQIVVSTSAWIRRSRNLLASLFLMGLSIFLQAAPLDLLGEHTGTNDPSTVQTEHVQAQLLAFTPQGLQANEPAWLGLRIQHLEGWHTYWKNPGDSGLATELTWQLPAGVRAGEIQWPSPQKLRIGQLANYGYENTVLLPVPLEVSKEWLEQVKSQGQTHLSVQLDASWLVCKLECIPEFGSFTLNIPIFSSSAIHATEFEQAFKQAPKRDDAIEASVALIPAPANSQGQAQELLELKVMGLPSDIRGQSLELFAQEPHTIRHGAVLGTNWHQQWNEDGIWSAQVPFAADRDASPDQLDFVLKPLTSAIATDSAQSAASHAAGWQIEANVSTPWQARVLPTQHALAPTAAASSQEPSPEATPTSHAANIAPVANEQPALSLSQLCITLLFALIGGALLNLMPCVFPILSIKALSLVKYTPSNASVHHTKTNHTRPIAWMYGAGVVCAFLALGALMLILRSIGSNLGWGFQLQSPWFVASMAILFMLIGLSLAGVFSIAAIIPQRLAQANPRSALLHAFLSGILAVLIAAPCTGPFMGAALGASLSMPAWAALCVFVFLGVGMALPFMLLVWFPGLLQRLPKPGQWMATFQKAMAFPMFATVIWLIWVLSFQVDSQAVISFIVGLWAMSFALWLWVYHPQKMTHWAIKIIWSVAFIATVSIAVWAGKIFHHSALAQPLSQPNTAQTSTSPIWQPWSQQAVDEALARNQAVFVDFTASWCITCQFNKLNTLSDQEVLDSFAKHNVLLLRADWTRQNPEISAALKALGRNGVPTYALYQNGNVKRVMTEILDRNKLLKEINQLTIIKNSMR